MYYVLSNGPVTHRNASLDEGFVRVQEQCCPYYFDKAVHKIWM